MDRAFVCHASEMEKESSRSVRIGGQEIALFRNSEGEFFATADSCTHEQWSLGEDGDIEGNEVTFPLHMARFDIRSGSALCLPATEALATYKVEIDPEEQVFIVPTEPSAEQQ